MAEENSPESKLHKILDDIFYGIGTNSLAQSQNAAKLASAAKHRAQLTGLDPVYATVQRVREYLRTQPVTQTHKPTRKRFPRTAFVSPKPNHLWMCDCGYLNHLSRDKRHEPYFLAVQDLFSKRLWAQLLPRITSEAVARAFERITEEASVLPAVVGSDRGSEFVGAPFKGLLRRLKIRQYHSSDDMKMAPLERTIRTLKSLLHRMLQSDKQQRSYVQLFQVAVYSYNWRPHSSLPPWVASPMAVNSENAKSIYEYMYTRKRRKMTEAGLARFRLNIGDTCRISKSVGAMFKGFRAGHWSGECYTVVQREGSVPPRYRLADYTGARVTGSFYFEELQRVPKSEMSVKPYEAKRVFGRRNQRGTARPQVLVTLGDPEADPKTAYWLDENLVTLPRPKTRVNGAASIKQKKPRQTVTPQVSAQHQQRRSNRVRRAPVRMDL